MVTAEYPLTWCFTEVPWSVVTNVVTSSPMADKGHLFSVKEAARACDVSPETIRRRLRDDAFEHAEKIEIDGRETWQIPLGDLLANDFVPTSAGTDPVVDDAGTDEPSTTAVDVVAASVVDDLEARLSAAEHRAELAEVQLGAERQRVVDVERIVTALEGQVRALNAGPQPPPAAGGPVVLTEAVSTAPLRKKSWWRR